MIKKVKTKLLVLLACLAALFLLGGCTLGLTLKELIDENNLVAQVSYYANGGKFDGSMNVKEMYYKENSPILDIGNNADAKIKIENTGFDFAGWYYIETDSSGNLVKKEDGSYKLLQKVDFTERIQKGEHWHIAAGWSTKVVLNIQLVCDAGVELTMDVGGEEKTVTNGAIIDNRPYDPATDSVRVSAIPSLTDKNANYIFVEYYEDEACTKPVSVVYKEDGQQTDGVVYARYIEKSWTVVKNANAVKSMFFNATADKKYWLAKDVDLKGEEIKNNSNFACELQGNGFTIKNLKVNDKEVADNYVGSLFGDIAATAVIQNVTFENVIAQYAYARNDRSGVELYFVCRSIADGATINAIFAGENSQMKITVKGDIDPKEKGLFGAGVNADTCGFTFASDFPTEIYLVQENK